MRLKNEQNFNKIENFIDKYTQENDRSPSNREIAAATGLSSATVTRYMMVMRERGIIEYNGQRNIITRTRRMFNYQTIEVPILGNVACGIPMFAEENIEEYVRLPVSIFGRDELYLLHANGDSMIDIGIMDGDLILIKKQNFANPGQVVVALIGDDEATLKRYYPELETGKVRLHPENSNMKDIYVDKCIIQGIAVKVMKDIV